MAMGKNRVPCKDCERRFKSLSKSKEEGLCLTCYYKKYNTCPSSYQGNAPKFKK